MAIPQPGFVGTRDSYRQNLTGQQNMATQAVGMAADQLERKRQFDTANQLKMVDDIVQNQHNGNYAEFFRGEPLTTDEEGRVTEWAGNPLAEQAFRALYGRKKGTQLFEEALYGTDETSEQIVEGINKEILRFGQPKEEGGPVHTDQHSPLQPTPAAYQTPQQQQARQTATREGFQPGVPQAQEQAQPPSVGMMPSATAITPEKKPDALPSYWGGSAGSMVQPQSPVVNTSSDVDWSNISTHNGFPVSPEGHTVTYEVTPDSVTMPDQTKRALAYKMAELQAKAAQQGATTNERGLTIGPGQEYALLPLNNGTTPLFSGITANREDFATEGEFTSAIAKQISAIGGELGGPEVAAFLGQRTSPLIGNTPEHDAAWEKYNADSQRLLGVDGQTAFAWRNQLFDNIQKGRPSEYMPTEEEKKNLWWWTGENMPVAARAQEFNALENPTIKDAKAVVQNGAKDMDYATMSTEDMVNVQESVRKISGLVGEEVLRDASNFAGLARSNNIPERDVNNALSALISPTPEPIEDRTVRAINRLQFANKRVTEKAVEVAKSDKPTTVVEGVRQAREGRELETTRRRGRGDSFALGRHLQMTAARRNEIYQQLNEREYEDMDVEIRSAVPLEQRQARLQERQFNEAIRQFDTQMTFSKKQWEAEAPTRKARAALMTMQAMETQFKMQMLTAEMEALENGETPPDYTVMYEANDALINKTRDELWSKAEDADDFAKQWQAAMDKIPGLKGAVDTNAEIMAYLSGTATKEVAYKYQSGGFAFWKEYTEGTMKQATLDTTPVQPRVPNSTVNTGGNTGGNTQTTGGTDWAQRTGF